MFCRAYLSRKEREKKPIKSSICYCSLGDGATEWQHGEAITAGTGAKLQAPEQIQGKVWTYLDFIWEKWGKKTFGRLVLQHLIPPISLSKCVLFKESPNVI